MRQAIRTLFYRVAIFRKLRRIGHRDGGIWHYRPVLIADRSHQVSHIELCIVREGQVVVGLRVARSVIPFGLKTLY